MSWWLGAVMFKLEECRTLVIWYLFMWFWLKYTFVDHTLRLFISYILFLLLFCKVQTIFVILFIIKTTSESERTYTLYFVTVLKKRFRGFCVRVYISQVIYIHCRAIYTVYVSSVVRVICDVKLLAFTPLFRRLLCKSYLWEPLYIPISTSNSDAKQLDDWSLFNGVSAAKVLAGRRLSGWI